MLFLMWWQKKGMSAGAYVAGQESGEGSRWGDSLWAASKATLTTGGQTATTKRIVNGNGLPIGDEQNGAKGVDVEKEGEERVVIQCGRIH